MKVLMLIVKGITAFLIFAALMFAVMFIIIGAVMFVVSIVTDLQTTEYERIAMAAVMLLAGGIGMMMVAGDD